MINNRPVNDIPAPCAILKGCCLLVKRFAASVTFLLLLSGCGSTWTAKDVGRGMQVGSMGGNGSWLAPIVWGTGFFIEQIGEAINNKPLEVKQSPDP